MLLANAPLKLVLPFANAGGKNTIPVASQIGITAGAASFTDGFPPLTRTPVAAGGIPPFGLDMNGVLFDMSAIDRWANAGAGYVWDMVFASDANVGGYPASSRVVRSDSLGYWLNTSDNNVTDPESAGGPAAGWVPDSAYGVVTITMTSSNVTLTPLQGSRPIINIIGTLTTNLNLIFPVYAKNWTVLNNTTGAFTITCKTASGAGVQVLGTQNIVGDGTNIYYSAQARQALTQSTTFYVATTGNDSTGTGLVGAPWATINKAISYLTSSIDLAGFMATIQLADGTYGAGATATGSFVGRGSVAINGNSVTPSNVVVPSVYAAQGAVITISNMKLVNGSGIGAQGDQSGIIYIGVGVIFGACSSNHMSASNKGQIYIAANYSLAGNTTYSLNTVAGGLIQCTGATLCTVSTAITVTAFANAISSGQIDASSLSFTGSSVTGSHFNAANLGLINTNGGGANFFPGSTPGTGTTPGTAPYGLYL